MSLLLVLALASAVVARQQPVPPPPADDYHPIPGPFVAVVDAEGRIEDTAVFDNEVASWAGPTLSAFRLCIQPGQAGLDPRRHWDALQATADALRQRGAGIVLIEPMSLCPSPPIAAFPKAHVEIRGLVRARPLH